MSAAPHTWVDGVSTDAVPADDRGLQYGDGLFETILVRGRRPRFIEAHLARLLAGCRQLAIELRNIDALRGEIATACAEAPPLAVVKVMVTRGSVMRRGYAPDGTEVARRIVTLHESAPLDDQHRQGVALAWASGHLADNPALAGIKHLARLENVIASREARATGSFDALMRGSDGRVVSGAMTNLFIVRAGRLLTPSVDRAGIAGILRGMVLRESRTLGIEAVEAILTPADLATADGVFITNARIGVVPVRRVGEHECPMNEVVPRLGSHIECLDA